MSQDYTTPPKTNEERLKHTADSLYQSYLKTIELINSNVGSTYLPSEKIDTLDDVTEDLITIAQDSIMYAITGRVLSITEDLGFDEEIKDILNNEVQNQIHRIERLFGYTRGSWGLEVADSPPLDSQALDSPALDSPALDSPALDSPALDSPAS